MKTKIKRHYRSAVSILLSVCMLISCMTVGLIATDAARTDSEVVGTLPATIYFKAGSDWDDLSFNLKVNYFDSTDNYLSNQWVKTNSTFFSFEPNYPENAAKIQFLRMNPADDSKEWNYGEKTTIPTDGKNYYVQNSGWNGATGSWSTYEITYEVTVNAGVNGSVASDTIEVGATPKTLPTPTPNYGYRFDHWSTEDDATVSITDENSATSTVSATGTGAVTANFVIDNEMDLYLTGRFRVRETAGNDETFQYTGDKSGDWATKCTKPAFKFTSTGKAFEYKLDTHCTLAEVSENLTYGPYFFIYDSEHSKWWKPSSSQTLTPANKKVTLVDTAESTHNEYLKFNASASTDTNLVTIYFNTNTKRLWYSNWNPATEHIYSLSGNVTDKYIVDSEVVKPKGMSTNDWWAMYHPELAINDGSGDTYKITFTTTNYTAGSINVGLAGRDDKQYSFNYGGTEYNTNGNDLDLTTPEIAALNGISNVGIIPSVSGGSLKLLPNTTYTITIKQTGSVAFPDGVATSIEWHTVYANAFAMVQDYNIDERHFNKPVKSSAHGTATATIGANTDVTVSGEKDCDMVFTASEPGAGYLFKGWFSDPECTHQITEGLSGEGNRILTETNAQVTKTRYALYQQDKSQLTERTITLNIVGSDENGNYGTVVPVSGASVTNATTLKAYDRADVVLSANPKNEGESVVYSFVSASKEGGGCVLTTNGNKITIADIDDDVTVTVTFSKKTTNTVTVSGSGGAVTAQVKNNAGVAVGGPVSVASGGSQAVQVPVDGTITLTASTPDANHTFSYFNLEEGKFKRFAEQSPDKSPMTFRPIADMTAEANFTEMDDIGTEYTGTHYYGCLSKDGKQGDYKYSFKVYESVKEADSSKWLKSRFKIADTEDLANGVLQSDKLYYFIIAGQAASTDTHLSNTYYDVSNGDVAVSTSVTPSGTSWNTTVGAEDNDSKTAIKLNVKSNVSYIDITWGWQWNNEFADQGKFQKNDSSKYPVSINAVIGEGSASYTPTTTGLQKVYAMDGSERGNGTQRFGDTTIAFADGMVESDVVTVNGECVPYAKVENNYNIYYLNDNEDAHFRIQTKVDTVNYPAIGVLGFVYNGKGIEAVDSGDGIYYADIVIPANSVVDVNGENNVAHGGNRPILEVYPVYKNIKYTGSDLIKFYVDANTIDNNFGYNIGYYIWFKDDDGTYPEFGYDYPGQPLMQEGTKYYGYIPKCYMPNDAASNESKVTTKQFAGVLLNNLAEESSVHKSVLTSWGCSTTNYQTFDYEDPAVIKKYAEDNNQNINIIEFVAKYDETDPAHRTGTHWVTSYNTPNTIMNDDLSSTTLPASIEPPAGATRTNDFELLRDFDNRPVDIYGNLIVDGSNNPITESSVSSLFSSSVFVVSVGNQTVNLNDWDTVWVAYEGGNGGEDGDHDYITKGTAASFIHPETQSDTLKNKLVYICYEKFTDGNGHVQANAGDATNNSGDRIDGRWLYALSEQPTRAHIRVATVNRNGDTLTFMTQTEGAANARIAYYDDSVNGYTQNGVDTHTAESNLYLPDGDDYGRMTTFANRGTKAKAVINNPNGYRLVGFYQQKTGVRGDEADHSFSTSKADYDEMTRESATIATFTNSRENYIVAIVEPIPKSNLNITHEMYGGVGAHYGAGHFYFWADVLDPSGNVIDSTNAFVDGGVGYQFQYLTEKVSKVENSNPATHYKVKITIRTVMMGSNTLNRWYEKDLADGSYNELEMGDSFGQSGTRDKVIEIDVNDLFGVSTTGEFQYTNLEFYSDIDTAGSIVIHHDLLETSTGTGDTYVVVNVTGGVTKTIEGKNVVSIPSNLLRRDSGNSFTVTLRTEPNDYSTFNNFYQDDGATVISDPVISQDGSEATKLVQSFTAEQLTTADLTDPDNPVYTWDPSIVKTQYYSDLTKEGIRYEITYNYESVIWKNQGYKVSGEFTRTELDSLNDERTAFDNDTAKAEFLYSKAPYEDNFRQVLKWKGTDAGVTKSENTLIISVQADSTPDNDIHLTIQVPFEATWQDKNGVTITETSTDNVPREEGTKFVPTLGKDDKIWYKEGGYSKSNIVLTYMTYPRYSINGTFTTENIDQEKYLQAPKSIWTTVKNGEGEDVDVEKFFSYWLLKKQGSDKEYAKNYSQNLNTAFYCDTIAEAVYENVSEEAFNTRVPSTADITASIRLMEQSRNQWNNGLNGTNTKWDEADRLISDYLLAFSYNGKTLKKMSNMTFGVLYETLGELQVKEGGGYDTEASHYNYQTVTSEEEAAVKAFINGNESSSEKYLRSVQSTAALDNKNQIQYTYTIKNGDETLRREYKYYRVYAFLKDSSGNVTLSAPIFQTIYDIASIQNGSADMQPTP